ncbi:reticulon-4 receptor-like 2 isoform X2 [Rana temporaria]|uniref:reticulon-4 receptor-like 2 isoform X2 n=1 Tax=Rana temporaria TaxID=8407 RepID=UPI001AACE01A|nr:reticulon-4 receptor-like 2 isoform X2 [Rana temporaria]
MLYLLPLLLCCCSHIPPPPLSFTGHLSVTPETRMQTECKLTLRGFLLHLLSLFPLLPLSRSYPFSLSPCPSLCTCYPSPPTASCQSHNLSRVPSPLPNQARRVFLQNNQISELSPGLFSPLTSVLWLFSNRISVLHPGTFQGLEHLEELDLGKNPNLPPLQPDTLSGLNSLLSLHLYQCNIHRLPADLFRGLHSLRYLYLQHNRLTGLPGRNDSGKMRTPGTPHFMKKGNRGHQNLKMWRKERWRKWLKLSPQQVMWMLWKNNLLISQVLLHKS